MPDLAVLLDSWPWKIAIAVTVVALRELVRRFPLGDAKGENRRALIETLDSAAITIVLVLFVVQPFILQPFKIPSGSMENTLQVDDRILVSKFIYRLRVPQHNDAIVFRAPPEAHPDMPDDTWIKRCIGVPGDVITIEGRTLYRNGRKVEQPFSFWDKQHFFGYDMKIVGGVVYSREYTYPDMPGLWSQNNVRVNEPLQSTLEETESEPIPPGKLLMLGDHRNNSADGHVWGLLDEDRVVGKAICVFWPLTRCGTLDRMSQSPASTAAPMASHIFPSDTAIR